MTSFSAEVATTSTIDSGALLRVFLDCILSVTGEIEQLAILVSINPRVVWFVRIRLESGNRIELGG